MTIKYPFASIVRFFDKIIEEVLEGDAEEHLDEATREIKAGNPHGVPHAEKAIAELKDKQVTDAEEAEKSANTDNTSSDNSEPSTGMDRAV